MARGETGEELLVRVLWQLHLALHLVLLSARRSSVIGGGGGFTSVRPPGRELACCLLWLLAHSIQFVTVLSVRQDLTVTNVRRWSPRASSYRARLVSCLVPLTPLP